MFIMGSLQQNDMMHIPGKEKATLETRENEQQNALNPTEVDQNGMNKELPESEGRTVNSDSNLETAFHRAAEEGDISCVTHCVECGVEIDCQDLLGRTAAHLASYHGHHDILR